MNAPAAPLPAFKAYDVRGKLPHEINPRIAYLIGQGLAATTGAKTAVLGMDSRLSSPELLAAAAAGLISKGVAAQSLGLCGTEEVYHAAGSQNYDLGIMITASHNPADYNGMKFIRKGGAPFTHDTDMPALKTHVQAHLQAAVPQTFPAVPAADHRQAYIDTLFSIVDTASIPSLSLVMNAGNGAAGPTASAILQRLPQLNATRVHFPPDGTFPHGIPNPLLPENRPATTRAIQTSKAALGIAWDGDFDRCFFYDEHGAFINNYYLCALLARALLARGRSTIVHDPRLYRDTVQTITEHGGTPLMSKVGHGYIKPDMRRSGAVFGGEISGHFYFRDFFCCDSGMLTWLLVLELMGKTGKPLSALVAEHAARAPASDEINFRTPGPAAALIAEIKAHYRTGGARIETFDGVDILFPRWRANLRPSSNEPLLRLNVEASTLPELQTRLAELTALIQSHGATLSSH